jgi:hypothetical protein
MRSQAYSIVNSQPFKSSKQETSLMRWEGLAISSGHDRDARIKYRDRNRFWVTTGMPGLNIGIVTVFGPQQGFPAPTRALTLRV